MARTLAGTHALVIGISDYSAAGGHVESLLGPAVSAARFARWLRTVYHHPDYPLISCRVLLSPLEAERMAMREELKDALPATRDNVEKALEEWASDADGSEANVAILFGAGHGCYTPYGGGLLCLEGFGSIENLTAHALNIRQVVDAMAQRRAFVNYCFVDACRNALEAQLKFDLSSGVTLAQSLTADVVRKYVKSYFATAPSTAAWTLPDENTTVFSKALMNALNRDAVSIDKAGRVCISANELYEAVKLGVANAAAQASREYSKSISQEPEAIGSLDDIAFHFPPSAPVNLTITVEPSVAATSAHGRLFKNGRQTGSELVFTTNPQIITVDPGDYSMLLSSLPPPPVFEPRNPRWLVLPRTATWVISVGED